METPWSMSICNMKVYSQLRPAWLVIPVPFAPRTGDGSGKERLRQTCVHFDVHQSAALIRRGGRRLSFTSAQASEHLFVQPVILQIAPLHSMRQLAVLQFEFVLERTLLVAALLQCALGRCQARANLALFLFRGARLALALPTLFLLTLQ